MNHSFKQKVIAGAVTVSAVFGTASLALAHDGPHAEGEGHLEVGVSASTTISASTTPVRPKDVLKEKRDEVKERNEERKEQKASTTAVKNEKRVEAKIELKARLDAKKQENVIKVIRNRINAFRNVLNAQNRRLARLEEVSEKYKAAGKNTTVADGFILDAKVKIAHASSTLASISVNATSTATSSNPTEKLNGLKTTFDSVKSDIKVVHEDINDAIKALRGLGSIKLNATSTTSTSSGQAASTTTSTQ